MALASVRPIRGSKALDTSYSPQTRKRAQRAFKTKINQNCHENHLPCWLGFVDWVDAPLHPNSLFGVGHLCCPFAVVLPVLWSSDSYFFLVKFQAEILIPQHLESLVVDLVHDVVHVPHDGLQFHAVGC